MTIPFEEQLQSSLVFSVGVAPVVSTLAQSTFTSSSPSCSTSPIAFSVPPSRRSMRNVQVSIPSHLACPIPRYERRGTSPVDIRRQSPIDFLPNELISMIMQSFIESAESNEDIHRLSCISRSLREIAFNTPQFWSKIIFIPAPVPNDTDYQHEGYSLSHRDFALQEWFLRAAPKRQQDVLLDIVFKDSHKLPFGSANILRAISILQNSRGSKIDQWRSVRIELVWGENVRELSNLFDIHLVQRDDSGYLSIVPKNLEDLYMSCQFSKRTETHSIVPFFGCPLSSLRRAVFEGVRVDWIQFSEQITNNTLEEVQLDSRYISGKRDSKHFIKILQFAPFLHTLSLVHTPCTTPYRQSRTVPFFLPNLKRLKLSWYSPSDISSVAEMLALLDPPMLEEVTLTELSTTASAVAQKQKRIHTSRPNFDISCIDFQPLIKTLSTWNRSCSLLTLHIEGIWLPEENVDELRTFLSLPLLKNVESLTLRQSGKVFIDSLRPSSSHAVALPSIKNIYADESTLKLFATQDRYHIGLTPSTPVYHEDGKFTVHGRPNTSIRTLSSFVAEGVRMSFCAVDYDAARGHRIPNGFGEYCDGPYKRCVRVNKEKRARKNGGR